MSRIEQIISDMEAYLDTCKTAPFSSNKIICEKDQLDDYLNELRARTPEEIKKYQRILQNKDSIINDAKQQGEQIINAAAQQAQQLVDETNIMQNAVDKADQYLNNSNARAQKALEDANNEAVQIRSSAIHYTDDMLSRLQNIIEHANRQNNDRYQELMNGLQNELNVVINNRNELAGANGTDTVAPEGVSEAAVAQQSDDDTLVSGNVEDDGQ